MMMKYKIMHLSVVYNGLCPNYKKLRLLFYFTMYT